MITLAQIPAGHPGRALLTGHTPWFAYQGDPRFSYGLYIPRDGEELEHAELLVVVHGTDRRAQSDLDTWAEFAEERNLVIMAPLFPVGIDGPDDLDGYKSIENAGVRYDQVLFGMLDEIRLRWGVDSGRCHLAGHSGGGQFALRMLLRHPQDGFGSTRRERLDTLAGGLRALGADPGIFIAPGGTHSAPAGTPAAQEFIGKLLARSPDR